MTSDIDRIRLPSNFLTSGEEVGEVANSPNDLYKTRDIAAMSAVVRHSSNIGILRLCFSFKPAYGDTVEIYCSSYLAMREISCLGARLGL